MTKYVSLIASIVAFALGYALADALGDAERESLLADYSKRFADVQEKHAAELESEREQRVKDVDSLLKQLHESHDRERNLVVRADRLQRDLASSAKRKPQGSSSCRTCEERLSQCKGLLGEGVVLSSQGGVLAERIAVKKDGLASYLEK